MVDFDEKLIPTLEDGLQKTRDIQRRLMERLKEAEAEADRLRCEITALEESAEQTEKFITKLLFSSRSGMRSVNYPKTLTLEGAALPLDALPGEGEPNEAPATSNGANRDNKIAYLHQNRVIPPIVGKGQPLSRRFSDRTIIQACTLLLRESPGPLHVNELYNMLVAGGMKFNGKNPTISIAVSLSRHPRFRKVDKGTFELDVQDGLRAVS